jgi:phosphatidylglycerol---prolipoprotein diacylglyceryl transferase
MHQTLFKVGPLSIHSYGVMIAIGFLIGLHLMQRDARKRGLDPEVIGNLVIWGLVAGLIGTRLLHILMFPELYSWADPIGWIAIWRGGLVFQGAIPVVIVFAYLYLKWKKTPFGEAADTVIPFAVVGHAVGRLGCFFNGCCYGKPTTLPWGIPFPRTPWDLSQTPTGCPVYLDHLQRFHAVTSQDHWSLPVHPTQLYSFLALLAISALLLYLRKRWRPFSGFTLPVYLMVYGLARFIIEFYRGDHNPTHFGALSDQQILSLLFVLAGAVLFGIMWAYAARTRPVAA